MVTEKSSLVDLRNKQKINKKETKQQQQNKPPKQKQNLIKLGKRKDSK